MRSLRISPLLFWAYAPILVAVAGAGLLDGTVASKNVHVVGEAQSRTGGTAPGHWLQCEMAIKRETRPWTPLGKLLLFGTGKQLPYDAGKYKFCRALAGARYFLALFDMEHFLTSTSTNLPGRREEQEIRVAAAAGFPELRNAEPVPFGNTQNVTVPIRMGLCLPEICTKEDVATIIQSTFHGAASSSPATGLSALLGLLEPSLDREDKASPRALNVQVIDPDLDHVKELDDYAIGSLMFFGLLLLTVFSATYRMHVYGRAKAKHDYLRQREFELDRRLLASYASSNPSLGLVDARGLGEVVVVSAETIDAANYDPDDGSSSSSTPSPLTDDGKSSPIAPMPDATTKSKQPLLTGELPPQQAVAVPVPPPASASRDKNANSRPPDTNRTNGPINLPPDLPPLWARAFSLTGTCGTLTKLFETKSAPRKSSSSTAGSCGTPVRAKKQNLETECLNGMRVLSMLWIILGHSFLMPEGLTGYSNNEDIASVMRAFVDFDFSYETAPWLLFVLAAEFGVDTFFFISGFLLSLLQLQDMERKHAQQGPGQRTMTKKSLCKHVKTWLFGLFQRYVRLTPSLALVLLFYYKVYYFLIPEGPFSPLLQSSIKDKCDSSWWSELTYTVNFLPFDSNQVCMGWTWYLGNDMLFFAFGTVVVPLYFHSKKRGESSTSSSSSSCCKNHGFLLLTFALLASTSVTYYLIATYDLGPYLFDEHYLDYSYYAYSKPYCRIGAYLVGVATAWHVLAVEKWHVDHVVSPGAASTGAQLLQIGGVQQGTTSSSKKKTVLFGEYLASKKVAIIFKNQSHPASCGSNRTSNSSTNSYNSSSAPHAAPPPSTFGSKRATLFLIASLSILLVLILAPSTDAGEHKNSWTAVESNLLLNFGRIFWALAIAFLTVHCYFGHYEMLDSLLSHPSFTAFTRLTYGAYLVHPLVIKWFAGTTDQFYHFSPHLLASQWLLNAVLSFGLSVVVWCLAERPVLTIAGAYLR